MIHPILKLMTKVDHELSLLLRYVRTQPNKTFWVGLLTVFVSMVILGAVMSPMYCAVG